MSENFCVHPWRQLYISTDGEIRTCCNGKVNLGNIKHDDVSNILKSEKLKSIQNEFLDGKWPKNCMICNFEKKMGFISVRETSEKEEAEIRKNPDEFRIETLEYRWSNTCNLSCVYCNEENSSVWQKIKKIKSNDAEPDRIDKFHNFLNENLDGVKSLRLYGGEPLLLKDNTKFLEKINSDVPITISTNLSIPNLYKNKIFNILCEKKNVEWLVSFENIGRKFEYVRDKANWDMFEKNLHNLLSHTNFNVTASACYNSLSALDIEEFYSYCNSLNNLKVRYHGLITPYQLHVHRLPDVLQKECIKRLENVIDRYGLQNNKNLIKILRNFDNKVKGSDNLDYLHKFLQETEIQLSKNQHYKDLWPEFI